MRDGEHRQPLLEVQSDSDGEISDTQQEPVRSPANIAFTDPLGAIVNQQPLRGEDPPPSYSEVKWSNSRPITDLFNDDEPDQLSSDTNTETYVESSPDPFASLSEGPRTVTLTRQSDGFGFRIAGGKPTHVATVASGGPAADKGLNVGDQILEINGEDVMQSNLSEVSHHIQLATSTMTLVVVPGNPNRNRNPWAALLALEHGDDSSHRNSIELAIDPTQRPPDNFRHALCSCMCCPLVASAALWHSRMVHRMWDAGLYNRSRAHAIMSRKLSSSAVLYGILIIVFYVFVRLGKDEQDAKH